MARAHASIAEFIRRVVGRSLVLETNCVSDEESFPLFHSSSIELVDVVVIAVEEGEEDDDEDEVLLLRCTIFLC